MSGTLIGYARRSTDDQDLTAQRDRLRDLGVAERRSTSTTDSPAPTATAPGSTKNSPPSAAATPSSSRNSTGSPDPCPTRARSATTSPPAASSSPSAGRSTPPPTHR